MGEHILMMHSKKSKPQPKAPDNLNQLFGSYTGTYCKLYKEAFDGSLKNWTSVVDGRTYKRKTNVVNEVREDNNQRGKDANFDYTDRNVHSPVKFER